MAAFELDVDVLPQPDDITCGPTCLHAVYSYWQDDITLQAVIEEVEALPGGGTLGVRLGCHALRRGYAATIFTYNLHLFDPTWFVGHRDLEERLQAQLQAKPDNDKLVLATHDYQEFLSLGGKVRYAELTRELLQGMLSQGTPILTGLSATYLYDCAREYEDRYNDVSGTPAGHFVVVRGLDVDTGIAKVADPLSDNPRFGTTDYSVSVSRLMGAILLGVVTYDANLLVIRPADRTARQP